MQMRQSSRRRGFARILGGIAIPVFALALMLLAWSAALAAVDHPWRDNLTRADVVNALGDPVTSVKLGAREILTYPNSVRIELQNGVVTTITGPVPDALKPTAATPSAPALTVPATSSSTAAGRSGTARLR